MNYFYVAVLTTILSLIFGAATVIAVYLRAKDFATIKKLKNDLSLSLVESLELATTDQLQNEARKRSFPYIQLSPITEETRSGITIEVHNVNPSTALGMLKMATLITTKEMKERGVEMPELPDFLEDDDD